MILYLPFSGDMKFRGILVQLSCAQIIIQNVAAFLNQKITDKKVGRVRQNIAYQALHSNHSLLNTWLNACMRAEASPTILSFLGGRALLSLITATNGLGFHTWCNIAYQS